MVSYSFPWLLKVCSEKYYQDYPKIQLDSKGAGLSPDELLTNFSEVARCSYEKFSSKPYWIPLLIQNVDICGRVLGSDWRLITDVDLKKLTADDLIQINSSLSGAAGNFWASFYVGMRIYIKSADGVIREADLGYPEKGVIISDLLLKEEQMKMHLEGGRALRCIKVTDI